MGPVYYDICPGCVFTDIPPADCIHRRENIRTPQTQSDRFCEHCCDVIEESKIPEAFHLYQDNDLGKKVAELKRILEMAVE